MRLKLSVVDGAEPVFKLEVEDRGHSQRSSWPNPWKPEELATTLRTLIAEVLSDRDIPLDVVLIGPLASDHALSGTVKDQVRNVQTPEKVASFHHWDEAVLAQAVVKEEPPPAARSFALSVANPGEMRALKQMPINAGSYDLADERKEFGAPDRTGPAPTSVLIPVFGAPPDLSRLGNNTKDYARQLADAWATDVHKICLRRPTAPTVDLVQTYATRYRQLGFVDVPAESALPSPATLSSAAQRYCDAVIAELKADGSDRDEQSYADLATHFPDLASEALLKGPPHQNLSGDLVVWTNKSDRADPGPLGLAWPGEIVLSERAAPNVSAFDKIKIPRPGYAASMLPPSMATITAAVPRSGIGNWVRWLGGGTKSVPFIGGAMAAMIAATLLFLEQSFDLKDRFVPPQTYLGPFDVSEPSTATVSCTPEVAPAENVTAAAAFCTSKLSFNSGPDLRPVPSPSQIGDDPRAACALIHYRIVRATVVREGENSIPVTYAGSGRTGESNVWRERCDKLLDTEILRQFAYTPIDGSPPLTLVGPPTAAFPLTAEGEELAADGKVVRSNRIFWHENITEAGLSILDVFWAEPIEGVGGKPAIGGWDQTVTLQDEEPTTPLTSLIGKCWVYGISGQVLISPDYEDRAVSLTPETVERAIFDAVQTPVAAPDRLLKLSFDGPDGTGAYSWVIGPLTDPPSPESETDLQKPCYP